MVYKKSLSAEKVNMMNSSGDVSVRVRDNVVSGERFSSITCPASAHPDYEYVVFTHGTDLTSAIELHSPILTSQYKIEIP